jgi:hypothetical protein
MQTILFYFCTLIAYFAHTHLDILLYFKVIFSFLLGKYFYAIYMLMVVFECFLKLILHPAFNIKQITFSLHLEDCCITS